MKHPHAELMAAYAADAMETNKPWERWELQGDSTREWQPIDAPISFYENIQYRRKPQKEPADLSVLVDSGIDCEFSSKKQFTEMLFGKLERIDAFGYQRLTRIGTSAYTYCRPRLNHIHAWQGGDCPLPFNTMVRIHYRDYVRANESYVKRAGDCYWEHRKEPHGLDIIAFEVIGLADGYCYPWECE